MGAKKTMAQAAKPKTNRASKGLHKPVLEKTPAPPKTNLITNISDEDRVRYDLSSHKGSAGAASHLSVSLGYASMEEAFPTVDPEFIPFGGLVLIQVRRTKDRTAGGLFITDEAKESEKWNAQVGKVISMGPIAYHSRKDFTPWPEGSWCKPGEFVRFPKFGGDRWELPAPDGGEPILFILFEDKQLFGRYTGDPLKIKAFV